MCVHKFMYMNKCMCVNKFVYVNILMYVNTFMYVNKFMLVNKCKSQCWKCRGLWEVKDERGTGWKITLEKSIYTMKSQNSMTKNRTYNSSETIRRPAMRGHRTGLCTIKYQNCIIGSSIFPPSLPTHTLTKLFWLQSGQDTSITIFVIFLRVFFFWSSHTLYLCRKYRALADWIDSLMTDNWHS